jgi:hypothetical protein
MVDAMTDEARRVLRDNRDDDGNFTCSQCGSVFPKGWSEDEVIAEAEDNGFDLTDPSELVVVCESCYRRMSMLIPPKLYTGRERQS